MYRDFKTYLMYNAGGIWVALAEIPWLLQGTISYVGPLPGDLGTKDDYLDTVNNWSWSKRIPASGPIVRGSIVPDQDFPSWNDYYTHAYS